MEEESAAVISWVSKEKLGSSKHDMGLRQIINVAYWGAPTLG